MDMLNPYFVLVNKVWLEPRHINFCIWCVTAFMLQWQSWIIVTEALWPEKLRIFAIWLFTENFTDPCTVTNPCQRPTPQESLRRAQEGTSDHIWAFWRNWCFLIDCLTLSWRALGSCSLLLCTWYLRMSQKVLSSCEYPGVVQALIYILKKTLSRTPVTTWKLVVSGVWVPFFGASVQL